MENPNLFTVGGEQDMDIGDESGGHDQAKAESESDDEAVRSA